MARCFSFMVIALYARFCFRLGTPLTDLSLFGLDLFPIDTFRHELLNAIFIVSFLITSNQFKRKLNLVDNNVRGCYF